METESKTMANWTEIKLLSQEEGIPHRLVAAEVLQIAFLDGIYGEKESLDLIFHGGTAIRLLHSGYRYSEDLDFCVPTDKPPHDLERLVQKAYQRAKDLMFLYLGQADFELKKKERKKIPTWWLNVLVPGEREKYRVKIEFGIYPSYSKKFVPLQVRNRFLPRQPMIASTDIKELLADKLNAIADRPYVKERDFFDLWYLRRVLQVPIDLKLVRIKLKDYHAKAPKKILEKRLEGLNASSIAENLSLFLPIRYRSALEADNYREMVEICRTSMEFLLENDIGKMDSSS